MSKSDKKNQQRKQPATVPAQEMTDEQLQQAIGGHSDAPLPQGPPWSVTPKPAGFPWNPISRPGGLQKE